jgi:hypothetical protein
MFVALMVLAIAVTRLFPDTATGRFLHRWLAEKPAAWIDRIERKQIIFLLLAVGAALILREAAPMLAGTSELALLGLWDASVYLDVVMAVWTLGALSRGRAGWAVVRQRLVSAVRRGRPATAARPRAVRSRSQRTVVANDDDGDGLVLAA